MLTYRFLDSKEIPRYCDVTFKENVMYHISSLSLHYLLLTDNGVKIDREISSFKSATCFFFFSFPLCFGWNLDFDRKS